MYKCGIQKAQSRTLPNMYITHTCATFKPHRERMQRLSYQSDPINGNNEIKVCLHPCFHCRRVVQHLKRGHCHTTEAQMLDLHVHVSLWRLCNSFSRICPPSQYTFLSIPVQSTLQRTIPILPGQPLLSIPSGYSF